MIRVGDKVKFLNDVGGGTVTKLLGKNLVNVENEDGFEIPTLISQLVKENDDFETENLEEKQERTILIDEQETKVEPEPTLIPGKDHPDFYLALVPQVETNPVGGDIEAWLVNDSNFSLIANYTHLTDGLYKNIWNGTIKPNSVKLLESFDQSDLSDFPDLLFQIIYFSNESKEIYHPIIKNIKVNPVKFYKEKTFSKTQFFTQNALLLAISNNLQAIELDKLTDSDIQKVLKEKEKADAKPKQTVSRKQDADLIEVDLHINEILDDVSGLSKHEILEIQMDKFKSEIEWAIKNKVKRIVFIHGLGQGTLKAEVIKELKSKYKKYYFQDASFKEYGYGATMVMLRKG